MKNVSSVSLPTKAMEAQDTPVGDQQSTWYHLCPSTLYLEVAIVWPKSLPYLYEIFLNKKACLCINVYFGIH